MKERPIIFTGEMVRAILDGRKTQTRRVVKPQPIPYGESSPYAMATQREHIGKPWMPVGGVYQDRWPCPYGQPGDRLWVRETWRMDSYNIAAEYRATTSALLEYLAPWKPSIQMPRRASRITLEITGVRVERLQDISEEDAKAEGLAQVQFGNDLFWKCYCKMPVPCGGEYVAFRKPKDSFESLWESINGTGSWDSNPFVWVIEFRKETKP